MSSWSSVRDHEAQGRCTRRQCQWRSSLPGRQLQSKQDWDNQIAATLRAMALALALALACPCHVYGKSEGDQQCLVYGQGCGCKLNKWSMSNSCAGLSSFVSNSIPFCSSCCVSASNAHFLSLDEFPLSRNGCGPQKRKQKLSKTFFFGKRPSKTVNHASPASNSQWEAKGTMIMAKVCQTIFLQRITPRSIL